MDGRTKKIPYVLSTEFVISLIRLHQVDISYLTDLKLDLQRNLLKYCLRKYTILKT